MNADLIPLIQSRLRSPLPGHQSHRQVMNHRRSVKNVDFESLKPRRSAVLLHFYLKAEELHLSYIERPKYKGVHSGQISFPGGKVEEQDASMLHTAIREANEEVNISIKDVEVIGTLSEIYIPPSNFLVQPYVSFQKDRPDFIPQLREVHQIIEVPLSDLMNQELRSFEIPREGGKLEVKGYSVGGRVLWGATAMITKELIDICSEL